MEKYENKLNFMKDLEKNHEKIEERCSNKSLSDIDTELEKLSNLLDMIKEMENWMASDTNGPEEDKINHPNHYTNGHGLECIDEMLEVFGTRVVADFCLCNVWKYRRRAIYKNGEEDMQKAEWYMNKFIELKNLAE